MKQVLFTFFFFSVMAVGLQAQSSSCSKTCAAKPASAGVSCDSKGAATTTASATEAAAKLASMDASIESKTCPVSGKVSYVRKETDKKGTVSLVDVSYDAATNSFVNASPMKMEGGQNCGTKASSAKGKNCCAGTTASGKACCAGKGKAASTSTTTNDGKAVKTSGSIN